jgi:5-methyltetrahydrofolate--homocysteine methyltransferase
MNQGEGLLKELEQAVIRGDEPGAEQLATKVLDEDSDPFLALEGLTNGIKAVGRAFQAQEIYLPEMMLGAKAMSAATAILMASIYASGLTTKTLGAFVIGTGAGDLHNVGKTIVTTIFSSHGLDVKDLGINAPSEIHQHGRGVSSRYSGDLVLNDNIHAHSG